MRRKALLIGNTAGLQGVQLDIHRFAQFLRNERGGSWYPNEIEIEENPSKISLKRKLDRLKGEQLDYLIVMFSGHGAYKRTTQLELNRDGDLIDEQELQKIAPRQLNIYDCCRTVIQESVMKAASLEARTLVFDSVDIARQVYEQRIMQAIPQQTSLYACSIGECSYDSNEGAVYLSALLDATKSLPHGTRFLTVGDAHEAARMRAHQRESRQNPDASLPKCIIAQQLILAVAA